MDISHLPYRLRTARQKKRLQRSDFDKQLLALYRHETLLWNVRAALPLVPLREPYQKGWKRSFIIRADVKRSSAAPFYEALLPKINTVEYSADQQFKCKKRRKSRKTYLVRQQYLKTFTKQEWDSMFTIKEKPHFHLKQTWNSKQRIWNIRFLFNEPWRYVLKVEPHIITHVKMIDSVLEQQISEVNNYIERNYLRPRMTKIRGGGYNYYRRTDTEKEKYRNTLKNKPLHVLLGQCISEQTTT